MTDTYATTEAGEPSPVSNPATGPTMRQQIAALALCGVLAIVGAGVALLLRDGAVSEHRADTFVDLSDIVPMEFWQANAMAGRFSQTIPRADVRDAAAAETGVAASTLTRTEVDQLGDSSIITVALTADSEAEAEQGLLELMRATFAAMLDADRSVPSSLVERDGPRLEALEADMAALVAEAGFAPGTNLAQTLNNETGNLVAASYEVELIDEDTPDWLESQVRAKQFAANDAVARLEPHVDAWYAAAEEADLIRSDVEDAREDLLAIERGDERLAALQQDLTISASVVASRQAAARTAAGGAAIGLGLALVVLAGVTLNRRRTVAP